MLGIDVGTSRTKAVLVDLAGREIAGASVATPFEVTADGVEMEVDAFQRCLQTVIAGLGDACRRVVGIGLAGMAESGAPLGAHGRPLAPIIAWYDGRGDGVVARLQRRFGTELPLRIGQPVRTVLTVSKLGWLVDQGLTGMTSWLGVPELCLHALTGSRATEFSLAARTGCYDIARRTWVPEVAKAAGFPIGVFPPVRAAGEVMGRISADGAGWSGLPVGAPVTVAGHDHLVGCVGAGVGPADVANSVGTAETLVAVVDRLPDVAGALAARVRPTVRPSGGGWAVLVGAARAGLVLERASSALGRSPQELDRLAADASPVDVGDAVEDLVRAASASFPDAPPGQVWAGLLRALAARTADAYDRLVDLTGPRQRVVVFGGGSASEPWHAAKAAALPVPVVRSPVESAPARGATLYAGIAAGWWPSVKEAPSPGT